MQQQLRLQRLQQEQDRLRQRQQEIIAMVHLLLRRNNAKSFCYESFDLLQMERETRIRQQ